MSARACCWDNAGLVRASLHSSNFELDLDDTVKILTSPQQLAKRIWPLIEGYYNRSAGHSTISLPRSDRLRSKQFITAPTLVSCGTPERCHEIAGKLHYLRCMNSVQELQAC